MCVCAIVGPRLYGGNLSRVEGSITYVPELTGATLGESTFPKFPDKTLRTVYSRRQKKLAHVQISTSRVTLL